MSLADEMMVQIHTLAAGSQHGLRSALLRLEDGALEVTGLGDGEHLGMILRLTQHSAQAYAAATVAGGLGQHVQKFGQVDVKGAARGQENAPGRQAAHRAEIDLAVPAE